MEERRTPIRSYGASRSSVPETCCYRPDRAAVLGCLGLGDCSRSDNACFMFIQPHKAGGEGRRNIEHHNYDYLRQHDPMPPTTSTTAAPPTTTITTENLAGAKAWFTSNVGILQDLQNDLNKVTDSGNTGNKSGVIAGCTQLASDTTAAQHLPPIPDTTIQGEWSDSLTDSLTDQLHSGPSEQ